jgi:YD repeat-containing protein
VEEQSENDTPGFWDYTVEEDVSYSGNAAWKRLYEMFTALGDYKDSAEIAGRFTILKDMYTGAENNRVDNMGNESTDREYELVKYNSQGQVTYSETRENFRLYGGYSYGELYFFYDETGRITKIQRGSGNNVSVVITPAYDDQGRMVSATYQSNDYNHELSYPYDAQGRLIENIVWNGSDRYWHTYTYDAAGNLVKDVYWYGWGSNYQMYRYTVDYTYDAQGYLVKEVKVYESYSDYWDEYTLQKTYTWEYTNDAQGRPVRAQYTELDRDGSTSYASQTITYHYNDLYFFD